MLNPASLTTARIEDATDEEPGALTVVTHNVDSGPTYFMRYPGFWKYREAERFALTRVGPIRELRDFRGRHG